MAKTVNDWIKEYLKNRAIEEFGSLEEIESHFPPGLRAEVALRRWPDRITPEIFSNIWAGVYSDLRDFTGENAPSTYTFWARHKVTLENYAGIHLDNPDKTLGYGKSVIHLFNIDAIEYVIICERASKAEIEKYLHWCFGMEE